MINVGKVLYINNDGYYLHTENKGVVVREDKKLIARIPIENLSQIVIFGNTGISNYFINFCAECNVLVTYISKYGHYYGRVQGKNVGNVLLRQAQYALLHDGKELDLVKNILLGKCLNSVAFMQKYNKDNSVNDSIHEIKSYFSNISECDDKASIRGYEGLISKIYFGCFDSIIKVDDMKFIQRSKRPPLNECNSLLSFFYTLLTNDCISALETFGLDSYLGFMHSLRPGKHALALNLIEEFRSCVVDRFVIELINEGCVSSNDFLKDQQGIRLNDDARKNVLTKWEKYKSEKVNYELYNQEIPLRIVPYLQAQLLAQYIRGDIVEYPPFVMNY